MSNSWKINVVSVLTAIWVSIANAGPITCEPDNQRVATLGDALECRTQNSINLNDSDDLNALFETDFDWIKEGELTAEGSNDLFSVDTDSWGTDVMGTWYIDESFWESYSRAVITMHVGQGGGDPDAFAWMISPGETSGSFSYERVAGKGGGLSNMFLFGSGVPDVKVPEPNINLLLAIGLLSIYFTRRRISS
ncbi:PEP-CTERM sorting domain-containing protein [Cellvibrio mixtus]|uniref:PEP-CTERM sorting domain-containing protein n=1 Tax=Cellvibrio mixtus TaxID=39650 RepID=UPI0005864A75|nr:PEP-CTERM sorting domain-containing protein [Cellvibrio mixtus]